MQELEVTLAPSSPVTKTKREKKTHVELSATSTRIPSTGRHAYRHHDCQPAHTLKIHTPTPLITFYFLTHQPLTMPRDNGGREALASNPPASSNSTEVVIIKSDHGDLEIYLQKPRFVGAKHGYAGWNASIERARNELPHNTQADAAFMFRVVRKITEIYRHRPDTRQHYSLNYVVARMRRLLQSVDLMFENDTAGNREWVAKIPHQGDIFALAFVAKGFRLGKAIVTLFTAWGMAEWARVLGTMPVTPAIAQAGQRVAAPGAPKTRASSKMNVEVSEGENLDDTSGDSDATSSHESEKDNARKRDNKLLEIAFDQVADTVSEHGDSLKALAVRMSASEASSLHEQGRVARLEEELQATQTH
ncbi:hypothetical protein IMZ48_08885, partial [Candidatus Bathyarchaeota archaeon]|nr:hypothetical protein [Candidatus Bathyarchaeota archaeon]